MCRVTVSGPCVGCVGSLFCRLCRRGLVTVCRVTVSGPCVGWVGSLCRVPVSGGSGRCIGCVGSLFCRLRRRGLVTVCRVTVSGPCVGRVRSLCRACRVAVSGVRLQTVSPRLGHCMSGHSVGSLCRVCRVAVSVMSGVSCQTAGCVGPFSISPGSVTAFLRLLNLGQCTISRISTPASF